MTMTATKRFKIRMLSAVARWLGVPFKIDGTPYGATNSTCSWHPGRHSEGHATPPHQ